MNKLFKGALVAIAAVTLSLTAVAGPAQAYGTTQSRDCTPKKVYISLRPFPITTGTRSANVTWTNLSNGSIRSAKYQTPLAINTGAYRVKITWSSIYNHTLYLGCY